MCRASACGAGDLGSIHGWVTPLTVMWRIQVQFLLEVTALVILFLVLSCFSFPEVLDNLQTLRIEAGRISHWVQLRCRIPGFNSRLRPLNSNMHFQVSSPLLFPGGWNALHVYCSIRVCRVSCVFGLILRQTSLNFSIRQSQRHGTRC